MHRFKQVSLCANEWSTQLRRLNNQNQNDLQNFFVVWLLLFVLLLLVFIYFIIRNKWCITLEIVKTMSICMFYSLSSDVHDFIFGRFSVTLSTCQYTNHIHWYFCFFLVYAVFHIVRLCAEFNWSHEGSDVHKLVSHERLALCKQNQYRSPVCSHHRSPIECGVPTYHPIQSHRQPLTVPARHSTQVIRGRFTQSQMPDD